MTTLRRHRTISIDGLVLLGFLVTASGAVWAQGAAAIPENAHANGYGTGWTCNYGHRELGDTCVAIAVPEHGYLTDTAYGPSWQCERGYRAVDDACIAIAVPEHGYLTDDTGYRPGWQCDRGYRAVDDACIAVEVPEHGYLTDSAYGPGWQCERGHRAVDHTCVALEVPENAHIDRSGNDWVCNSPYRKRQKSCVE